MLYQIRVSDDHLQNEAKEKTAAQNKENEEAKSQLDLLLRRREVTEKDLDELRQVVASSIFTRSPILQPNNRA